MALLTRRIRFFLYNEGLSLIGLSTTRCFLKRVVALFVAFPIFSLFVVFAAASSVVADSSSVADSPSVQVEHHLRLYHTHTGERIDIIYRRGDTFLPEAEAKLDYFLRDHRTGDVKHYDPHVFDILSDVAAAVGHPNAEIDIICGYRTPWSNEFLRARSAGVAKNSQHMQAHAIDIRIPGVDTLTLRNAALALARGGVGYYPRSGFVHVDTGRVRTWCYGCRAAEPTHAE
ncbi:MAG TPA: DUF882 domain-containing protein [Verrucomicrobiae bacterium]|nr:DUF882 domain-containing protein [Verrucomicrobiae bacterium]